LAEGRARVSDESQGEQSAQQPHRGKRLELVDCDDLGDKISCQPGNGDQCDQKSQASPLDRAGAAG
jgi:hypothetical protein